MTDILIIDDDETFGQLMLERFETTRWEVRFHRGPFGTLGAIRAVNPRLAIMDVNMPGLDGTQLNELVRKTESLAHMRVMFYSSMDEKELERLARAHKVAATLHKSASRIEFMNKVADLLKAPSNS